MLSILELRPVSRHISFLRSTTRYDWMGPVSISMKSSIFFILFIYRPSLRFFRHIGDFFKLSIATCYLSNYKVWYRRQSMAIRYNLCTSKWILGSLIKYLCRFLVATIMSVITLSRNVKQGGQLLHPLLHCIKESDIWQSVTLVFVWRRATSSFHVSLFPPHPHASAACFVVIIIFCSFCDSWSSPLLG